MQEITSSNYITSLLDHLRQLHARVWRITFWKKPILSLFDGKKINQEKEEQVVLNIVFSHDVE